jgi:YHS domain-containing protein
MKTALISCVIACACFAPTTLALDQHPEHAQHAASEMPSPVNRMCPIGQEPIVEGVATIEYKGNTIGFFCPGCDEEFMGWDEAKRDAFVASAKAGTEPGEAHAQPAAEAAPAVSQPYTLATCPVSGEKLGSMGDPIIKQYNGREVRFCCNMCIGRFEKNTESYFKQIDEQMIADQLPYYPMSTCVVSGEALSEDGEDTAINIIHANRLVRLCCNMCKKEFKQDPGAFVAKIDKAAADAQRADYPLGTCMIGGKLGSMGEPSEIVLAGRLVRFCCSMCEPKVIENPAKYLAQLDEAWAKQRP